jgi:hypothetical protein
MWLFITQIITQTGGQKFRRTLRPWNQASKPSCLSLDMTPGAVSNGKSLIVEEPGTLKGGIIYDTISA